MSVKKFVFRVANGRNQGPFHYGWLKNPFHCRSKFNDPDVYPNFRDDGMPWAANSDYIAAMPSACALFHWFGEDLDLLKSDSFRVYRIEVKKLRIGYSMHQAVYHRKKDKVGKMQIVPIKYKGLLK